MNLQSNNVGDVGATAIAESLKATLVTCVLQVRACVFPWQVCARTHRRRSATCRATGLAFCSTRLFRFFVLMCRCCVACRGVRCDQMPRVRAPTFHQLQLACMQKCRLRVRTHVINVSRTEHCERHRAIGTGLGNLVCLEIGDAGTSAQSRGSFVRGRCSCHERFAATWSCRSACLSRFVATRSPKNKGRVTKNGYEQGRRSWVPPEKQ